MRSAAVTPDEIAWADTCLALAGRPTPTALPATPGPTTTAPTPSPTPSSSTSAVPTPSSSGSTVPQTVTPTPQTGFPTAATTGVPPGWVPAQTRTSTLRVSSGTVQDVRIVGANLELTGPVTVRRVEIVGGRIVVAGCRGGVVIEDTSVLRGQTTRSSDPEAIGPGGYTARRVKLDGVAEGFRVGGRSSGCGPVVIEDSYARVVAPDSCGDWHGDGTQLYDAPPVTIRNVSLILQERGGCGGTAAFFGPAAQGNSSADIERLRVQGGGYPFRLGVPGRVVGLDIVQGWPYGPINVKCSVLTDWSARIVTASGAFVRNQPCNTEDGR